MSTIPLLTYVQWRLLIAGVHPVEWRDFYLGDLFCSLTYSLSVSQLLILFTRAP